MFSSVRLVNQAFQLKTLVIKKMNVGAQTVVYISFPEHNFETIILGIIIEQVNAECPCRNDNSASIHFLHMSPGPYFYLISGLNLNNHLEYFIIL